MNSMSDSGEFQEVESNHSGRLSDVSSQPATIPSSRSMLSRDKRLPLDTSNLSGSQENVFVNLRSRGLQENVFTNQFSTFDSPRDHPHHKENEDQFLNLQGRRLFLQEMTNKTEAQFQCRHLQEGR